MLKSKTATYTLEFEIKPTTTQKHIVDKRFKVAKSIYNACLNEILKRHKALKSDKEYRRLISQPSSNERNTLLKDIRLKYGFSEYQLHSWVNQVKYHFEGHLGINEVQKLASRAFKAVEKLHYGNSKKVFFKSKDDDISVENKNNQTGLRYSKNVIMWGKISLGSPIVKDNDKYAQLALLDKTKYVRILTREIRGKRRYFVQFCQEGIPPKKRETSSVENRVGIDIGTSTIAVVSDEKVFLKELAELKTPFKKLRRLDRAIDRSKRVTNSQNYNPDGTVKKGSKHWNFSNRYLKIKSKRKEIFRKISAIRKQSHEKTANEILSLGLDVRVETMRFHSLQKRAKKTTRNIKNGKINKKKRFGKSILNYAPAMLINILDMKLKYQQLTIKKIDTYSVKASQFNHTTGEFTKKLLSNRWNNIDNQFIQRDLYSAFLIKNTTQHLDVVDVDLCNLEFENFIKLHNIEISRLKQSQNKLLRWFVA